MAVAAESSSPLDVLASMGQNKSTKTLLRVIILVLIAATAIASRLFSVIRRSPISKLQLACSSLCSSSASLFWRASLPSSSMVYVLTPRLYRFREYHPRMCVP